MLWSDAEGAKGGLDFTKEVPGLIFALSGTVLGHLYFYEAAQLFKVRGVADVVYEVVPVKVVDKHVLKMVELYSYPN